MSNDFGLPPHLGPSANEPEKGSTKKPDPKQKRITDFFQKKNEIQKQQSARSSSANFTPIPNEQSGSAIGKTERKSSRAARQEDSPFSSHTDIESPST